MNIIKKYEHLSKELLALVKEKYPDGFEDNLISFQTPKGELALALPLETEDAHYMIKMPKDSIPEEDDDDGASTGETENLEKFESLEVAEDVADEVEDQD